MNKSCCNQSASDRIESIHAFRNSQQNVQQISLSLEPAITYAHLAVDIIDYQKGLGNKHLRLTEMDFVIARKLAGFGYPEEYILEVIRSGSPLIPCLSQEDSKDYAEQTSIYGIANANYAIAKSRHHQNYYSQLSQQADICREIIISNNFSSTNSNNTAALYLPL
jgi:hypothetical protein